MLSGRCHYHPDRLGLGICVDCRNVICRECTTQFEGINRCASCLGVRHAALRQVQARRSWTVGNVLWMLLSAGTLYGLLWLTARWVEG